MCGEFSISKHQSHTAFWVKTLIHSAYAERIALH